MNTLKMETIKKQHSVTQWHRKVELIFFEQFNFQKKLYFYLKINFEKQFINVRVRVKLN